MKYAMQITAFIVPALSLVLCVGLSAEEPEKTGIVRAVPNNAYGFFPDGKRIAAVDDRSVQIVDAESGKVLKTIEGCFTGFGQRDNISADGKRICVRLLDKAKVAGNNAYASATDQFAVIDTETGKTLWKIPVEAADSRIVLSPDGTKVITSYRHIRFPKAGKMPPAQGWVDFRVVDVNTGKELWTLENIQGGAGAAFAPDSKTVMFTDINVHKNKIFDAETGKEILMFDAWKCQYFPDGSKLAELVNNGSGEHDALVIRNIADGKELRRIDIPCEYIYNLAFSPDGKRAALCCIAGKNQATYVSLWDMETCKEWKRISFFCTGQQQGNVETLRQVPLSGGQNLFLRRTSEGFRQLPPEEGSKLTEDFQRQSAGGVGPIYADFSPNGKKLLIRYNYNIYNANKPNTMGIESEIWDLDALER